MEEIKMTDKEMLMLAYGALKAGSYRDSGNAVIELIERYLFGQVTTRPPEAKS